MAPISKILALALVLPVFTVADSVADNCATVAQPEDETYLMQVKARLSERSIDESYDAGNPMTKEEYEKANPKPPSDIAKDGKIPASAEKILSSIKEDEPPKKENEDLQTLKKDAKASTGEQTRQSGFKDFDELYGAAQDAQVELKTMLEGIAKKASLTLQMPPADDKHPKGCKAMADSLVKIGNKEKKTGKFKGDFTRMTDVCRASLVTPEKKDCDITAVLEGWKALKDKMVFLKNKFANPPPEQNGYADLNSLVEIKLDKGKFKGKTVVCEVQIHLEAMQKAKMARAHVWYEKQREVDRLKLDTANIDRKWVNDQIAKHVAIVTQKKIYESVWKKCFGTGVQWKK